MTQDAKTTDAPVHLFFQDPDGGLRHSEEYFELAADFAGHLPVPGDLIIYPGVSQSGDRGDLARPEQRTFYQVLRRVYSPAAVKGWIGLVVSERPGQPGEAGFLRV